MATHDTSNLMNAFIDKFLEQANKIDKAGEKVERSIDNANEKVSRSIERGADEVEKVIDKVFPHLKGKIDDLYQIFGNETAIRKQAKVLDGQVAEFKKVAKTYIKEISDIYSEIENFDVTNKDHTDNKGSWIRGLGLTSKEEETKIKNSANQISELLKQHKAYNNELGGLIFEREKMLRAYEKINSNIDYSIGSSEDNKKTMKNLKNLYYIQSYIKQIERDITNINPNVIKIPGFEIAFSNAVIDKQKTEIENYAKSLLSDNSLKKTFEEKGSYLTELAQDLNKAVNEGNLSGSNQLNDLVESIDKAKKETIDLKNETNKLNKALKQKETYVKKLNKLTAKEAFTGAAYHAYNNMNQRNTTKISKEDTQAMFVGQAANYIAQGGQLTGIPLKEYERLIKEKKELKILNDEIISQNKELLESQKKVNEAESIYSRARKIRDDGNVSDFDGNDWKYSKDMLYQYYNGVIELQSKISKTTDTKLLDDLNKDLDEAKVNFVALYDTIGEFFEGKLDGRAIKADVRNLFNQLAPQSDIDAYRKMITSGGNTQPIIQVPQIDNAISKVDSLAESYSKLNAEVEKWIDNNVNGQLYPPVYKFDDHEQAIKTMQDYVNRLNELKTSDGYNAMPKPRKEDIDNTITYLSNLIKIEEKIIKANNQANKTNLLDDEIRKMTGTTAGEEYNKYFDMLTKKGMEISEILEQVRKDFNLTFDEVTQKWVKLSSKPTGLDAISEYIRKSEEVFGAKKATNIDELYDMYSLMRVYQRGIEDHPNTEYARDARKFQEEIVALNPQLERLLDNWEKLTKSKFKAAFSSAFETTTLPSTNNKLTPELEAQVAGYEELAKNIQEVSNVRKQAMQTEEEDLAIMRELSKVQAELAKPVNVQGATDQIKAQEEGLKSLLNELKLLQKIGKNGNSYILPRYRNGVLHDDYGGQIRQGSTTKKSITDAIKYYNDKKSSIESGENFYNEKSLERALDDLAKYVAGYKSLDEAQSLFGKKNKDLWEQVIDTINRAKAAQEAYETYDEKQYKLLRFLNTDVMKFGDYWKVEEYLKNEDTELAFNYLIDKYGLVKQASNEAANQQIEATEKVIEANNQEIISNEEVIASEEKKRKYRVADRENVPRLKQVTQETEAIVKQEEILTSAQKKRIAQQKRYNDLKAEENKYSKEAVEIAKELLKKSGFKPSNDQLTINKLAAEYDSSHDMNKLLDILADRMMNSRNIDYLQNIAPSTYDIIDKLQTIGTIKYNTEDVEAFGAAWDFVQEKVGKAHFSLTEGIGWDQIDFSDGLKNQIYSETNDIVSGLSKIINDELFSQGTSRVRNIIKEQFINNGLNQIGQVSQEQSKIVINSFEDIKTAVKQVGLSYEELVELMQVSGSKFGTKGITEVLNEIGMLSGAQEQSDKWWKDIIAVAGEIDKTIPKIKQEVQASNEATTAIVNNEEKKQKVYKETATAFEERWDKITTLQDNYESQTYSKTKQRTNKTQSDYRTTVEMWGRDDEGEWQLQTVKIVKDMAKLSKEAENTEVKINKAQAALKNFMAAFDNKTLGQGNQLAGYEELNKFNIQSLSDIDVVANKMKQLDAEYNKVVQDFRKGTSSMNPFVNAINNTGRMSAAIESLFLDYQNLKVQSQDIGDSLANIDIKFQDLMNATNIYDKAKIFGELKVSINEVTDAIKIQRKEESLSAKQSLSDQKSLLLNKKKENKINDLIALEKQLLESGKLTDEVKTKLDELFNSLTNVSNTAGLSIWNEQLKGFKSSIKELPKEFEFAWNETLDKIDKAQGKELDAQFGTKNIQKFIEQQVGMNSSATNLLKDSFKGTEWTGVLAEEAKEQQKEYDALIKKVNELAKARKDLQTLESQAYKNKDSNVDSARIQAQRIQEQKDLIYRLVGELRGFNTETLFGDDSTLSDKEAKIEAYAEAIKKAERAQEDLNNQRQLFSEKDQQTAIEDYKKALSDLEKAYKSFASNANGKGNLSLQIDYQKIADAQQRVEELRKSAMDAGVSASDLGKLLDNSFREISSSVATEGVKNLDEYRNKINALSEKMEENGTATDKTRDRLKGLKEAISSIIQNADFSNNEGLGKFLSQVDQFGIKLRPILSEIETTGKLDSKILSIDGSIKEFDKLNLQTIKAKSLLTTLKDEYKSLQDSLANNNGKFGKDQVTQLQRIEALVKKINQEAYGKGTLLPETAGNVTDLKSLEVAMVNYARAEWNANQIGRILNNGSNELTGTFKAEDGTIHKLTATMNSLHNGMNIVKDTTSQSVGFFTEMGNVIKTTASRFSYMFSGYMMFHRIISAFRDGLNVLKDYDSALTTISYTMDLTKKQLNDLGESAVQMAKDLSMSLEDAMSIYQIYANMQTTSEEIKATGTPTAVLSNLSGVDAATAADQIQGVLFQFNMLEDGEENLAEKTMHVVDALDKISASVAIDYTKGIDTISQAIQASGQAAYDAGLSFEQLAALSAQVAQRTREDGGSIGNAIKTIVTRISKVGKMPSYEDEVDNETLSKASESLKKVGIDVYKANGEFQDLDITLGQLAEKWDSLSDAQQANISYNVAA